MKKSNKILILVFSLLLAGCFFSGYATIRAVREGRLWEVLGKFYYLPDPEYHQYSSGEEDSTGIS